MIKNGTNYLYKILENEDTYLNTYCGLALYYYK